MLSKALRTLAFLAFASAAGTQASAATMTFDNFDASDNSGYPYVENGITATGGGMGGALFGGSIHLDDMGTQYGSFISFTMPKPFRAISFQMLGFSFDYRLCGPDGCVPQTYDNFLIEGFRGGESIVSQWLNASTIAFGQVIYLPKNFTGLTSFRLSIPYPQTLNGIGVPEGYRVDCGYPCSHGTIDNVTLAPVPVPAGLPLVGSGLAILSFLRLRQRKQG